MIYSAVQQQGKNTKHSHSQTGKHAYHLFYLMDQSLNHIICKFVEECQGIAGQPLNLPHHPPHSKRDAPIDAVEVIEARVLVGERRAHPSLYVADLKPQVAGPAA